VIPPSCAKDKVEEVVSRLRTALAGIAWEVVFVDDDSPEGTAARVRELANIDARVRCLQRIGRHGRSTACVEGMMASTAPYLAVMDADLPHDETRLAEMLQILRRGDADLVIGTPDATEIVAQRDAGLVPMRRLAAALGRRAARVTVSDPNSGFFVLRRNVIEQSVRKLSGVGFHLLLDILASCPTPPTVVEIRDTCRPRAAGDSDSVAIWESGLLLADKAVGRYIPVRLVSFAFVGAVGVLVHFGVLTLLLKGLDVTFAMGQTTATVVAMVFNFAANNAVTYRDRRLRGFSWVSGLMSFMASCSLGALSNVGVATYLFQNQTPWQLAALAGILVGAAWNYAITQLYTWKHSPHIARGAS
jgi:dolichol-phosphate mannosyltransferase